MASLTLLAACEPAAKATTAAPPAGDSTPRFVAMWAQSRADCGAGFDSLLLAEDGSAVGWEMAGTWRATGLDQAEVHFTSSGMEEEAKTIDDRLAARLSKDGNAMSLGDLDLVKCPFDPNVDLAGEAAEVPPQEPSPAPSTAQQKVRTVAFRDLSPDESREIIAGLGECAVDVTADMTMQSLDINRDARPDWLIGVGRTTMSPCAGNAVYSKLLVSRSDGSFEGVLLNYAHLADGQTLQAQAFTEDCDDPHSHRRLQWLQGRLAPSSGCLPPVYD